MNKKFQKILPILLSIISSAGVVGTSILAVKNSNKYYNSEEHYTDKKKEAKVFLKSFWPSILCGAATIGSITAGTIISKKTEASLSAAVLLLERGYVKYQNKVKTALGIDTHNNIIKEIAKDETKKLNLNSNKSDGKKLYYNNYIGHFYAKKEDVTRAILNMNMRLHSSPISKLIPWKEKGICTIQQFVDEAQAEIIDMEIYDSYKDFGWTYEYLADVSEDEWIYDGYANESEDDETNETILSFLAPEPIYIPNGWNHDDYLLKRSEQWHGTFISDIQSDESDCDHIPPWNDIDDYYLRKKV